MTSIHQAAEVGSGVTTNLVSRTLKVNGHSTHPLTGHPIIGDTVDPEVIARIRAGKANVIANGAEISGVSSNRQYVITGEAAADAAAAESHEPLNAFAEAFPAPDGVHEERWGKHLTSPAQDGTTQTVPVEATDTTTRTFRLPS